MIRRPSNCNAGAPKDLLRPKLPAARRTRACADAKHSRHAAARQDDETSNRAWKEKLTNDAARTMVHTIEVAPNVKRTKLLQDEHVHREDADGEWGGQRWASEITATTGSARKKRQTIPSRRAHATNSPATRKGLPSKRGRSATSPKSGRHRIDISRS